MQGLVPGDDLGQVTVAVDRRCHSWVADDGTDYHLFFLMAPRSLEDPSRRHVAARVGHAVSCDLVDWDYRGECFGPSDAGFDDLAIWTGSVVRDGARWRMFYTALSTAGHHIFDQRVGSAVSDDLHHWTRSSSEPLRVDGATARWYKTLDPGRDLEGSSETWRDPVVLPDPDGDGWHLFVTARSVAAGRNDDGVIAHATSQDLATWTLGPPVSTPARGSASSRCFRTSSSPDVPRSRSPATRRSRRPSGSPSGASTARGRSRRRAWSGPGT